MRIVHVVYSMEVGGAESLVAQLCRLQRAQGHAVSVMAQAKLGVLGERMREEGFRVDVPGTGHPLRTFRRWLTLFRELRPDVVHCHNPAPTMQAAPAARLAGAKTIISTRHSLVAPPYNRKEEVLFGIAARFCDWVVGICEATCENLRGAPLARERRIVRVYNGSAELVTVSAEDRRALRAEAAVAAGAAGGDSRGLQQSVAQKEGRGGWRAAEPVIFLFVGRLAPIKDLGTMVRAFAEACALPTQADGAGGGESWRPGGSATEPESAGEAGRLQAREGADSARREHPSRELRLWIVGDGPERLRLQALAEELGVAGRVRFWGERHDVARFFAAADVFTMSSTSEGLPMSLLQAMSAGLPALVTDVGGMAEVVGMGGSGVATPVGDYRAMAEAMVALADDGAARSRFGEKARAAYAERFTLERMEEGYLRLYAGGGAGLLSSAGVVAQSSSHGGVL